MENQSDSQSQNPALKRLRAEENGNNMQPVVTEDTQSKKARLNEQQQQQLQNQSHAKLDKSSSTTTTTTTSTSPNSVGLVSSQQNQLQPSRVIHVRGLPLDVSEQELMALCAPFGRVTQLVLLRNKQQALIEIESIPAATALVQYYNTYHAIIRYFIDTSKKVPK